MSEHRGRRRAASRRTSIPSSSNAAGGGRDVTAATWAASRRTSRRRSHVWASARRSSPGSATTATAATCGTRSRGRASTARWLAVHPDAPHGASLLRDLAARPLPDHLLPHADLPGLGDPARDGGGRRRHLDVRCSTRAAPRWRWSRAARRRWPCSRAARVAPATHDLRPRLARGAVAVAGRLRRRGRPRRRRTRRRSSEAIRSGRPPAWTRRTTGPPSASQARPGRVHRPRARRRPRVRAGLRVQVVERPRRRRRVRRGWGFGLLRGLDPAAPPRPGAIIASRHSCSGAMATLDELERFMETGAIAR